MQFIFYFPGDDVTKAMTEVCLNILEDDIQLREEAYKAMEIIMKDAGAFPTEIREYFSVLIKVTLRTRSISAISLVNSGDD